MRSAAALALTSCVVAALAGPAHAAATHTGECVVRAVEDTSGQALPPGTMAGRFRADVEVYDPGPPRTPVAATVTCSVWVNGVQRASATGTGTGRVVVDDWAQWTQQAGDEVRVCTLVEYANGSPAEFACAPPLGDPSSVLGGVTIDGTAATPTYTLQGNLANPLYWTCSDNGTATPYAVTCVLTMSIVYRWHCDAPRADVAAIAVGTQATARLDCDSSSPAEAVTGVATGPLGRQTAAGPSGVVAAFFVCTIDNGAGGGATAGYVAACSDPGA